MKEDLVLCYLETFQLAKCTWILNRTLTIFLFFILKKSSLQLTAQNTWQLFLLSRKLFQYFKCQLKRFWHGNLNRYVVLVTSPVYAGVAAWLYRKLLQTVLVPTLEPRCRISDRDGHELVGTLSGSFQRGGLEWGCVCVLPLSTLNVLLIWGKRAPPWLGRLEALERQGPVPFSSSGNGKSCKNSHYLVLIRIYTDFASAH